MWNAPPQLLQPRVAPAAGSIELVPHRILDVEILVIVLGGPELSGRHDRCDNIVLERFRLREHPFGGLGETFLLFGVIEDRGAVLAADVAELPVSYGRIDVFPEHFEEPFVAASSDRRRPARPPRARWYPRTPLHSWDFSWF